MQQENVSVHEHPGTHVHGDHVHLQTQDIPKMLRSKQATRGPTKANGLVIMLDLMVPCSSSVSQSKLNRAFLSIRYFILKNRVFSILNCWDVCQVNANYKISLVTATVFNPHAQDHQIKEYSGHSPHPVPSQTLQFGVCL